MEERVARFADIDTRRAMGLAPRKLPPSDLAFPLGKIRTSRDHALNAFAVFVSFDDTDIYFYKLFYDAGDDSDICVWYFNERDRYGSYERNGIPWHRIGWPDIGRNYRINYGRNGSCTVMTQGWEENWPNLDDWTKNGRELRRYKTTGGRYMIVTLGPGP